MIHIRVWLVRQLQPFNGSLVLSLTSILEKFPKTDILGFIHTDESSHVDIAGITKMTTSS